MEHLQSIVFGWVWGYQTCPGGLVYDPWHRKNANKTHTDNSLTTDVHGDAVNHDSNMNERLTIASEVTLRF